MDTRRVENVLGLKYGYKKLPDDLSAQYREFYKENIPVGLSVNGGGALYTKKGTMICSGYRGIVIGDYGAFVAFDQPADPDMILVSLDDEGRDDVKYRRLTIFDNSNVRIRQQVKTVDYADFVPGTYYVNVHEVRTKEVFK